ncbi:MAG: PTS sugar transporter subunit IIA, partial [Candidatus Omnitrophica bacterium]|nr:PTS sugar transporter subunit IIA [Candidatus Omnitrophota bacterium]
MKITEFLDKRGIKLNMASTEKEDALKELVDVLAGVADIGDKKSIVRSLIERENLGSTGIG